MYVDSVIFTTAGYRVGYTTRNDARFRIAAIDDYHGEALWAINETDGGGIAPRPHEDSVYVATGATCVYAIDHRTSYCIVL